VFSGIPQSYIDKNIHVSPSALFKFTIADMLSDVDIALYLDGDVIVNGNLDMLFRIPMDDTYIAASDDMGDSVDKDGNSFLASRIRIKEYRYFNSGVMLLNLRKIREDKISLKLIEYRFNGINYFMDQDAFNYVFCRSRKSLPYEYNFRAPLFDIKTFEEINEKFFGGKFKSIEECIQSQKILHLTGRKKPWNYNIPWFTDIFRKYYALSPYHDTELVLSSPLKSLMDEILKLQENEYLFRELVKRYKEWRLPKEIIPEGCRLVLYGAGEVGNDYYRQIMDTGYCEIISWVDRDFKQKMDAQDPKSIIKMEFDYILIAIEKKKYIEEVKSELEHMGIDPKYILNSFEDKDSVEIK